jgi:hypothetical protein
MVAVMVVMLAAGCANLQWHKPEADADALARDIEECRQSARAQAQRETLPRAFTSPLPITADRRGQVAAGPSSSRDADVLLLEQNLTRACMENKGYRLAPAENR